MIPLQKWPKSTYTMQDLREPRPERKYYTDVEHGRVCGDILYKIKAIAEAFGDGKVFLFETGVEVFSPSYVYAFKKNSLNTQLLILLSDREPHPTSNIKNSFPNKNVTYIASCLSNLKLKKYVEQPKYKHWQITKKGLKKIAEEAQDE